MWLIVALVCVAFIDHSRSFVNSFIGCSSRRSVIAKAVLGVNNGAEIDTISRGDISYITLEYPKESQLAKEESSSDFEIETLSVTDFSNIFLTAAPYIAKHRSAATVIHLPGKVIGDSKLLDQIMVDISIMHLLGVELVLVLGTSDLLDDRLEKAGLQAEYHLGKRIIDDNSMQILKEVSGLVRFEAERSLTRSFVGQESINVVSANSFYVSQPIGVRDGVDFQFTGSIRKIEAANILKRLAEKDIVLLSTLGYSTSGESFAVSSETLAADCARQIRASKIIYYTSGEVLKDKRTEKPITSLRLAQAVNLVEHSKTLDNGDLFNLLTWDDEDTPKVEFSQASPDKGGGGGNASFEANGSGFMQVSKKKMKNISDGKTSSTKPMEKRLAWEVKDTDGLSNEKYKFWVTKYMKLVSKCVHALNGGVSRAHLITPHGGTILKEMYSRDGAGCLIARDIYEDVRPAQASDIAKVEELLAPLVTEGILVPRSRDTLEKDLPNLFVMTRDESILACGMLKKFGDDHAELCCIAVSPQYRREGKGETMLQYLERRAVVMGVSELFLLSTRTMNWFLERGFSPATPQELPESRHYDYSRNSKVYTKKLKSLRAIDAEELLWDVK
jgi:amino-acid N-acetyltransferase